MNRLMFDVNWDIDSSLIDWANLLYSYCYKCWTISLFISHNAEAHFQARDFCHLNFFQGYSALAWRLQDLKDLKLGAEVWDLRHGGFNSWGKWWWVHQFEVFMGLSWSFSLSLPVTCVSLCTKVSIGRKFNFVHKFYSFCCGYFWSVLAGWFAWQGCAQIWHDDCLAAGCV